MNLKTILLSFAALFLLLAPADAQLPITDATSSETQPNPEENETSIRILNFQADNGFQHKSKSVALEMVERLGEKNGWEVVTTIQSSSLTELDLSSFDAVVFNNNCGNKGQIMKPAEQLAFQKFIQNGGGFVAVHCAGAIWKEGGDFQQWYEGLVGTKMVDHPKVQKAKLIVEDQTHPATAHLPAEWVVKDEFHRFGSNPREKVNVLISVDEDSYKGKQKMGGDLHFTGPHQRTLHQPKVRKTGRRRDRLDLR